MDSLRSAETQVHDLRSLATGHEHRVFVAHCDVPGDERPPSPLYILDGNGHFGAAVDIVRSLQLSRHLPPILVVGVGYPVALLRDTIAQRTLDLTPTADPAYAALFDDAPRMGGASAFLRFLVDELRPWLARAAGPVAESGTLFGHSLAGLFAGYALLTEPAGFSRYIVSSPSLWWHDRWLLDAERSYAEEHDDLAARVVIGIGEDEDFDGRQREASRLGADGRALAGAWPIDMVADAELFARQLTGRGYPGLRVESLAWVGEMHISVWPTTLTRGLRILYDAPR
jgi:predicted alpha/beta superfamily hydrolase